MGVCCFNVANAGGLRCEFLLLFGTLGVSMCGRWFVYDDGMSPVGSCADVGLKVVLGRLRLLVVCCVCVVVQSTFCGALGVLETLVCYVNGGGIDLQYTLEGLGGRQIGLG